MEYIACNKHTKLRWNEISLIAFFLCMFIFSIGMAGLKNVDDDYLELIPKLHLQTGFKFWHWVIAVFMAIIVTFLSGWFASGMQWVLTRHATTGWPRYFYYAFKFSDSEVIVGWMKIMLNASEGTLKANGMSFSYNDFNKEKVVSWNSEIVSGGLFKEYPTCYILYNLNEDQASRQQRTYRDGLLRFKKLQRSDLIEGASWPAPSDTGVQQYFGHQQAIDKDSVRNLAYAETATPLKKENFYSRSPSEKDIFDNLNHCLQVRKDNILDCMNHLQTYLKKPIA